MLEYWPGEDGPVEIELRGEEGGFRVLIGTLKDELWRDLRVTSDAIALLDALHRIAEGREPQLSSARSPSRALKRGGGRGPNQ